MFLTLMFLVLGMVPQEKVTISRAGKAPYAKQVPKCMEAAGKINSNPREAIELLDAVLEDGKVKERECRIRWSLLPGTYSKWYDFFPYRYRAQAKMKLAESADAEKALTYLRGAEMDLAESARRGLASSNNLLSSVRDRIKTREASLSPDEPDVPEDPEPKFRKDWTRLLNRNDFIGARNHITKKGRFLSTTKKKGYLEDTDLACVDYVESSVVDFLDTVESIQNLRALEKLSRSSFDRRFELPSDDDLTVVTPSYSWSIQFRDLLWLTRKGGDREKPEVLGALLGHAIKAESISKEGEVQAFLSVEKFAHEIVQSGIERRVTASRDAAADSRQEAQKESKALLSQWETFSKNLRKAAKGKSAFLSEIPDRDFTEWMTQFPVDAGELKDLPAKVLKSTQSETPRKALSQIEGEIRGLRERFDTLSIESRRSVVTWQIVVRSMGLFLKGDTVEDAIRDSRSLGSELKRLGGAFEVTSYGPKMKAVFQGLR